MATDGPTPAPCDKDIFELGHCVFVTHTIPSNAIEQWVQKIAKRSGQPVDWHYAGGRAVVLALGDLDKVQEALEHFMPEHNELMKKELAKYGLD